MAERTLVEAVNAALHVEMERDDSVMVLGEDVGRAMAGGRPVCEMQYESFSYPCLDQLICHVGRYRWRTGGAMEFPITVRMPYGGRVRAPELHDDSPEGDYAHTPGVKG